VVETQILDRNLRTVSTQGSFASKTPNFEEVKQVPHSEQATGRGESKAELSGAELRHLANEVRLAPAPKPSIHYSFFVLNNQNYIASQK